MISIAQSLVDDLIELGREIVERLEEIFNPNKKRRELARVPVPVRSNPKYPEK